METEINYSESVGTETLYGVISYDKAAYTHTLVHSGDDGDSIILLHSKRPLDFATDIIPFFEKKMDFDADEETITLVQPEHMTEIVFEEPYTK